MKFFTGVVAKHDHVTFGDLNVCDCFVFPGDYESLPVGLDDYDDMDEDAEGIDVFMKVRILSNKLRTSVCDAHGHPLVAVNLATGEITADIHKNDNVIRVFCETKVKLQP